MKVQKYINMMKFKGTILCLAFYCSNPLGNDVLDKYVQDCIDEASTEAPGMMEGLESMGVSWEEYCKRSGESEIAWEKSGKPIYYVRKSGCEFLGLKGSEPFSCLPKKWPKNIIAIQLEADEEVPTKRIHGLIDSFHEAGVEQVLIKTSD